MSTYWQNEEQFEALLDARVQRRLSTDRDYLHAENSEEQALAERKIELQEELVILQQRAQFPPVPSWVREHTADVAAKLDEVKREIAET